MNLYEWEGTFNINGKDTHIFVMCNVLDYGMPELQGDRGELPLIEIKSIDEIKVDQYFGQITLTAEDREKLEEHIGQVLYDEIYNNNNMEAYYEL